MSNIAKTLLKPLLAAPILMSGLLLAGCGGNFADGGGIFGNGGNTATTQSTGPEVTLTGAAVKGVVANGIVQAHLLKADSNGNLVIGPTVGPSRRTDSNGQFTLKLGKGISGWVVVELTADSNSVMTCDVAPSCVVDGNGTTVAFGQQFPLNSQFKLDAAVNLDQGDTVYLTPLSELAVELAGGEKGGLTGTNLITAYGSVENWFGLKAGTLQLPPPDLTRLDNSGASVDAVQLSVINAAFLAMVDGTQWQSIDQVINSASQQVATQGQLAEDSSDPSVVTISTLESDAAVLASELQNHVTDSLVQQALAVVQSRSTQQYQDALVAAGTTTTTTSGTTATSGSTTTTSGTSSGTATTSSGTTTTSSTTTSTTTSGTTTTSTGSTTDTTTTTTSGSTTVAANSAVLDWQAPATREDGTALAMSELAGYVILYGQDPNSLTNEVKITDAYTMQYTLSNLASGTWYFAIKAVDTQGAESPLSKVVSKTI